VSQDALLRRLAEGTQPLLGEIASRATAPLNPVEPRCPNFSQRRALLYASPLEHHVHPALTVVVGLDRSADRAELHCHPGQADVMKNMGVQVNRLRVVTAN